MFLLIHREADSFACPWKPLKCSRAQHPYHLPSWTLGSRALCALGNRMGSS